MLNKHQANAAASVLLDAAGRGRRKRVGRLDTARTTPFPPIRWLTVGALSGLGIGAVAGYLIAGETLPWSVIALSAGMAAGIVLDSCLAPNADGPGLQRDLRGDAMSEPDNKALVDRYVSSYNAFDIDGMLELVSPDVCFENFTSGQLSAAANGADRFRELAEKSKLLFSEREQRITRLVIGPDSIVADIAYRARLADDLPSGPTAGSVITLEGQSEFHFRDGRITRIVDRS